MRNTGSALSKRVGENTYIIGVSPNQTMVVGAQPVHMSFISRSPPASKLAQVRKKLMSGRGLRHFLFRSSNFGVNFQTHIRDDISSVVLFEV